MKDPEEIRLNDRVALYDSETKRVAEVPLGGRLIWSVCGVAEVRDGDSGSVIELDWRPVSAADDLKFRVVPQRWSGPIGSRPHAWVSRQE